MANHRALWSFFLVFAIINVISLCAESDVNSIITDNGPLLRHLAEANGEDQNLEGRQSNRNKWKNTCCSECPRDNNDCSKSCKKNCPNGGDSCEHYANEVYIAYCKKRCNTSQSPKIDVPQSCKDSCVKTMHNLCQNHCRDYCSNVSLNKCLSGAPKGC